MRKNTGSSRSRKTHRRKLTVCGKIVVAAFVVMVAAVLVWLIAMSLRPVYEDTVYPRKYSDLVEDAAKTYDLDDNLIYAVIKTESGFDPEAVSVNEARGLMQVTEDTFDWISGKLGYEDQYVHEDLSDPALGIEYGCYLLHYLMELFDGETETVLAAYHAGMTITQTWLEDPAYSSDGRTLDTIPYADTAHYVSKVLDNYAHYREIYGE